MSLTPELLQILKEELENDPLDLGYDNYYSLPSCLARLINSSRKKTEYIKFSVTDPLIYLNYLENSGIIENIHIIKNVVYQMTPESQQTLSGLVTNSALPLLNLLNGYGIDGFLNTLGISHLVTDKIIFETVLRNVLEHAVNHGQTLQYAGKTKEVLPPRITQLFSGIENAPNAVTEQDIIEALE